MAGLVFLSQVYLFVIGCRRFASVRHYPPNATKILVRAALMLVGVFLIALVLSVSVMHAEDHRPAEHIAFYSVVGWHFWILGGLGLLMVPRNPAKRTALTDSLSAACLLSLLPTTLCIGTLVSKV